MKWNLECKLFPLTNAERENLMMSIHCASMMKTHDPMNVRRAEGAFSESEYRAVLSTTMRGCAEQIAAMLDSLYAFCKSTDQLETLESIRGYLIEAMRLQALLSANTDRILTRISAGSGTPYASVKRVYEQECERLGHEGVLCECPLCAITSIMENGADAEIVAQVTPGIQLLHDHIKGKGAIDDLLGNL